ncbi:hypothetical protein EYF80_020282 [Liparis tanakae]|uniref:Uncharacterized protein n=1 Tax=Liparis tanakae TaxID=230148 RepID=A0A4Z2HUV6_9TELE|nr:hypothetical protein EYF80_020282 [Liparis tanakae]
MEEDRKLVTLPARRGHVVVQSDGGGAVAVQTAVGHVQREVVGVPVAEDALPQHQVHAVAPRGGGGGVQDQHGLGLAGHALQRHHGNMATLDQHL